MERYHNILLIPYMDHDTNEEISNIVSHNIGQYEDILPAARRRKLSHFTAFTVQIVVGFDLHETQLAAMDRQSGYILLDHQEAEAKTHGYGICEDEDAYQPLNATVRDDFRSQVVVEAGPSGWKCYREAYV